ncbi:MAG: hypothetical protein H6525_08570 [Actinobacteria bacterium]|nr:hypothetical protein [Actinomycetota bacterium]
MADAVGRVLDLDPSVLRTDTPLVDLGADPVAVVAVVDLLRQRHPLESSASAPARPMTTLADIVGLFGRGTASDGT